MDFRSLQAPITVVLRYSALAPDAAGQAEIVPTKTSLKIHATVANLPAVSQINALDLAYVLWAISPEGRATNLGEVVMEGNDGKVDGKMVPGAFGLIVTAEPYFAVSRPDKAVVFEADLAPGSRTPLAVSHANCELLTVSVGADVAHALAPDSGDHAGPMVLEEARRAIAVARENGAQELAPDTLATAEHLLQLARDQQARGAPKKDVIDSGDEAVLIAEDARVLAVKRKQPGQRSNAVSDSPP